MPVVRVGAWCGRCRLRPAVRDGVCVPCERLLAAFGSSPRPLSRATALADLGLSHASDTDAFDRELEEWLRCA